MAYALADRWPAVAQVFRAPSAIYDFQSPPQLPGVAAAVLVCSDRMARHVEAMAGEREIVRLASRSTSSGCARGARSASDRDGRCCSATTSPAVAAS